MSGILEAYLDSAIRGATQPPFSDWFQRDANSADPNSDSWTTVENSGGSAIIENGATDGTDCRLLADSESEQVAIHTEDKILFSPHKLGSNEELHFKTVIRVINLTGEHGIGMARNTTNATSVDFTDGAMGIFVQNGVAEFRSDGSGGTYDSTAVTSYITANVDCEIEIVLTTSDAKCYIDGTLRATHTTSYPDQYPLKLVFFAKYYSTLYSASLDVLNVSVWVENTSYAEELTAARSALTSIPARTADALTKIDALFERFFNKMDISASECKVYQDDEASSLGTQSISSTGGTTTIGEMS